MSQSRVIFEDLDCLDVGWIAKLWLLMMEENAFGVDISKIKK